MVAAVKTQDNRVDALMGLHYTTVFYTGAYTAADLSITLGFVPQKVRVVNLTDRVEAIHYVSAVLDAGNNAKSLLTLANGTVSYEAAGISVSGKVVSVTVATKGLMTDSDDVMVECWG